MDSLMQLLSIPERMIVCFADGNECGMWWEGVVGVSLSRSVWQKDSLSGSAAMIRCLKIKKMPARGGEIEYGRKKCRNEVATGIVVQLSGNDLVSENEKDAMTRWQKRIRRNKMP